MDGVWKVAEVEGIVAVAELEALEGRLGERERLEVAAVADVDVS